MRDAVIKYGLFYGALLVVGAIAWRLTSLATDAAGGHGATMLSSSSVGLSVGVGLAAIALAVATGLLATRLHSASAGVLDMGVVLAWGAFGFGTLRQVVAARAVAESGAGTRSTFSMLAVEAAIVGAIAVAAAFFIERAEKRLEPAEEPKGGAGGWLTSLACGAAGSAVGIWLIAQTGYKGQVIGAALVGGLLGGLAAYAVDPKTRMWPLVAGCAAVSVVGPVLALVTGGDDARLHAAAIAGSVTRLALPVGLDGIAGACLGVPVGLYIAKGLLGHAGQIAEQSH